MDIARELWTLGTTMNRIVAADVSPLHLVNPAEKVDASALSIQRAIDAINDLTVDVTTIETPDEALSMARQGRQLEYLIGHMVQVALDRHDYLMHRDSPRRI